MWAAGNGHVGSAQILADKGANLGLRDKGGKRADKIACEKGHGKMGKMLLDKIML